MTNNSAPKRMQPGFLAALELGVSPLLRADYSPMRPEELHTTVPARPDRSSGALRLRRLAAEMRAVRPERKTKGLIVTAEDILAGRNIS